MVMAFNNAPLLGAQAVVDVSGWADQFRDGQKLRQEYEARQQQKALNEIMKIGDHNGRLEAAQQHKYAGALVPLLQKYDEDRQKAALENLKTGADIGKIYGETSKLGAESGKIGAETTGLVRENTANIQNDISALAVTQNPQIFALGLGEMTKQGLISPERTDMMLRMITKDPQNAAKIMQSMVMANPELAKLFKPESKVLDAKDGSYLYTTNPFTGEANEPTSKINYGVSATDQMKDATTRYTNAADNSTRQYVSDNSYEASVYGTDVASRDRQLKLNQDGQIEWFNADTKRIEANKTGANGGKPRSATATKEMVKHKTNLTNNAYTMENTKRWISKIQNGELNLSALSNMRNSLANRTGIDSLGGNPAAYAEFKANMTKLASDALRLNAGVQTDMDYKRALEEMQAGTYIPRNEKAAIALLEKIYRDFDTKNRAEYEAYAEYKREYDGVSMPEYGKSSSSTQAKKPNSKGASIIGGILGGG